MFDLEPEGATPIDPDEARGLIPPHIRTREELNVWEQNNILEAILWMDATSTPPLTEPFVRELHRRMFEKTWRWAGVYRTSDKNIGVSWSQVPVQVRRLVGDGQFWMRDGVYSVDEAALRLHHKLVQIHPFPNGNGRHARAWCDAIVIDHGRPAFAWGRGTLDSASDERTSYIRALRAADDLDYAPLFGLYLTDRPGDATGSPA